MTDKISGSEETIQLSAEVPESCQGKRLDQTLAQLFPEHSRERLKHWILSKWVTVNGQHLKPKERLKGGEQIAIEAVVEDSGDWEAEPMDIEVVYEDEDIIILNKPDQCVVHPAPGNETGTLVNGLLYRWPHLRQLPRAGIIHRIDKDTTGLLIIAKTLEAHTALVTKLQDRDISREYEALVWGEVPSGGTIDAPIGRHPRDRLKMAVVDSGKPAVTHYRVIEKYPHHTRLKLQLETGRTHQIRVHLAHIHYPIVGDKAYGARKHSPKGASEALKEALSQFKRQALHAKKLTLEHPISGEELSFEAPLPEDYLNLLAVLKREG